MAPSKSKKFTSPQSFLVAWKVWHARIQDYKRVLKSDHDYFGLDHRKDFRDRLGLWVQYTYCLVCKPMYGNLPVEHREEAMRLVKEFRDEFKKTKVKSGCF